MFEEQYRRDNERLHAPADALERIRERAERTRAPRHAVWTRYAAAAAALLLVCGGAAGVLLRGRDAADGAALPQVASAAAPAGGGAQDALERSGDGYAAETEEAAQADEGALLYAAADGLYAPEDHAELYALIGQARADAAEAAEPAASAAENGLPASAPEPAEAADGPDAAGSASAAEAALAAADGQYRYTLSGGVLTVEELADGSARTVSETDLAALAGGERWEPLALHLCGGRLVALAATERAAWDGGREQAVCALLIDVSDPAAPQALAQLAQSGRYLASFASGGLLYVATVHAVSGGAAEGQPRSYCPTLYEASGAAALAAERILVQDGGAGGAYTLLTAVDPAVAVDPAAAVDPAVTGTYAGALAVLSGGERLFFGDGYLAMAADDPYLWEEAAEGTAVTHAGTDTRLTLVTLAGGRMEAAAALLSGRLYDFFAQDGGYAALTEVCELVSGADGAQDVYRALNRYAFDARLCLLDAREGLPADGGAQP